MPTATETAETLLTIIAAHDGIGSYDLVAATGHRHGRAFSREFGDALDALVDAGTVTTTASRTHCVIFAAA